ncbi:hypothetical protein [Vagococcus silagei]|uniref:hypothetical protein n=1 Tax=Vagococcus silagei TaxID=2508885 RepID=UPI0013A633CA|nr:hypothetical protein [Vagococcus silagei]
MPDDNPYMPKPIPLTSTPDPEKEILLDDDFDEELIKKLKSKGVDVKFPND